MLVGMYRYRYSHRLSYFYVRQAHGYRCRPIVLSGIILLISTPGLGVLLFFCRWLLSICPSVRLSVCHKHCFFFVSRWNRAIFWPSVFHDKNYETVFFNFDLGPLTPKIYSPKFSSVGHCVSHSLWVIVCRSTTFGLGTEIQLPIGLSDCWIIG